MSEKVDDLGLLYRRETLANRGVQFRMHPDTEQRYPLKWVATWRADGADHESDPLPMRELIPYVEGMLGPS
jgi:hypothetical protein